MRACCIMDCNRLQRSVYQIAERGLAAKTVVGGGTPAGGMTGVTGGAVSFFGARRKRAAAGEAGVTDHRCVMAAGLSNEGAIDDHGPFLDQFTAMVDDPLATIALNQFLEARAEDGQFFWGAGQVLAAEEGGDHLDFHLPWCLPVLRS